jgi:hypothetical protein
MARGIFGGFIGVVLAGIVAALLSSYSDEALVYMFARVTSAEWIAEAAKHPGPPGPAGPPGSSTPAATVLRLARPAGHDRLRRISNTK